MGSRLEGGRIEGGRVFRAGLLLTVARDEEWDLLFWLDPRFPRVECLPSRGRHDLPDRWRILAGAQLLNVSQPDRDRRLLFKLETGSGPHALEYFAFPKPALVLRDANGCALAEAGAEAPRPAKPGKPFLLDVLDAPYQGDPRALRGLDDLWLKAALGSGGPPWDFIVKTGKRLESAPLTGFVVLEQENPTGVSLVDFSRQLPGLVFEDCGSLSHASSRFISSARREQDLKDERTGLMAAALELKLRLEKTLRELEGDRKRQEGHGLLRENADSLKSQLGQIQKGQKEITVAGKEGERRVALDPKLKPHEQADRWYQQARRLRRGMDATRSRIEGTRQKLEQLDRLLKVTEGRLEADEPEVASAFAELEKLSTRLQPRAAVRVKQEPQRFRRFRSPGGMAIWVGRNNRENDELTLHTAHKEDLWFHAQQCPGSHVILRSHGLSQAPAQADILAAAATAAYYSRARTSTKVPVMYTLAKYVRKPRKALPGTVTVEREKSVMVEPRLCPEWDEPV